MENKELIINETYNEYGNIKPLDESVISCLQVLIPNPEVKDDESLSYKNCNSFELIYDVRHPQILYYLGEYMKDDNIKNGLLKYLNYINFNGITVGDSGDLTESYKVCESIKKWAENTMYLIREKCIKEYEEEKHHNINNKPQNNENN